METAPPASAPAGADPATGLWSSLKEALRGSKQDFTEGPLGRAILMLAVPMVVEMAMESVFAVADVFFVARLGADAVATVGITESMMTLLYAVAMGLSIGAMATVARRIGEKSPDRAAAAAVQAIGLGILVALPLGALGYFLAPRLLQLMGGSPWVIEEGVRYTRMMFAGNATILLLFLVNAIFRGSGDAAISMRVLWLANSINIALGPCLIFGLGPFPRLGVLGAAVATNIGRGTGVLYQLYRLTRGDARITVEARHLRLEPATLLAMLRLSGNAVVQTLIGMSSWVGLVRILASFGSAAVAGYTIAIRLVMFALLPSWGMSNAGATLVGQSLGAGKPARAERAVWRAGTYNAVFLGVVGAAFIACAVPLVALFTQEPLVAGTAVRALRIVSAGFLFYAYGMVITAAFNGAGDTFTPTLLNLGVFWVFELPLAWALARPLSLGPTGVFIAVAVAFTLLALLSALLFRRGAWRTRKV
ncbi:MAG: MATE family efflux transporter [Myxococcales bacterium]